MNLSKFTTSGTNSSGLFVKNITSVDAAIFDPANGISGQSWTVDAEIHGPQGDFGFVYDFSQLKGLVKQVLKDSIDHALIIPVASKAVDFSENESGESWRLKVSSKIDNNLSAWEYHCPKGAVYPVRCVTVRTDILEQELARLVRHRLPSSISDVRISLREESAEPTAAFFRYTHGISGYPGACQRLFHGHRSRLEIYIGDERRPDLEHYIVREVFGGSVHVTTPSQTVSGIAEPGCLGVRGQEIKLTYASNLGSYSASIPAERVWIVEGDTSIECISRQIALHLKAKEKTSVPIRVLAYEGINKGAIAYGCVL